MSDSIGGDPSPAMQDARLKWLQQTLSQLPDVTSYTFTPPPVLDPHIIDVAAIHAAWQARHDAEIALAQRQAIEAEIADLKRGVLLRMVRPAFDVDGALQSLSDHELHWGLDSEFDLGTRAFLGDRYTGKESKYFGSPGEAVVWLLREALKRYPENPGAQDWRQRLGLGEQGAASSA